MKRIKITEKIEKEFLKCFIDGKCKIKNYSISNILIDNETIVFHEKKCKLLKNIKEYFEYLQNKINDSIDFKEILLSTNLDEIIKKYSKYFKNIDDKKKLTDIVNKAYNSLRKKWGYKIVKLAEANVCLYCNRNFTLNFNEKETTVELDHYYPKEKYPFLALNLYNLVPSCHTCNHKKSNSEKNHLHPFFDDIDKEIKFSLKLKDTSFYHSIDGFNIEIETKSLKAQNHIEVFNLENLYNEHKDIILELIQKTYMYDESYLDELFKKYEGTFFRNKEDLTRLISGGYISEDEINKRPLSKLIKDMLEYLNLY
ncbi:MULTISPECIES: HNH endonuclease [unclassified Lebetimonas]|uniref:HNH endonuclease n=1 Tax=unclassified Lebetimonas TaxID=2648158 RepID=UPI0004656A0F|nr:MULTISPECIES: HNH endonuclease [unclassified Lebetimonas]